MSANINPSDNELSTSINKTILDNKYLITKHQNSEVLNGNLARNIVITEHLVESCPTYYVVYFKSVRIICKNPTHLHYNNDLSKQNHSIGKWIQKWQLSTEYQPMFPSIIMKRKESLSGLTLLIIFFMKRNTKISVGCRKKI